jgi:hypothetical protein
MARKPTDLEKSSLEAHVDLCALRYAQLDGRLTNLEFKVDSMHSEIVSGQKSLVKVIVGTAGTITAGILSVIIAILMRAG